VADSLAVEVRETSGKGAARKLRAAGRAPGVLYGHGIDPVPLTFDPIALDILLRKSEAGINTLIDLEGGASVAGKTVLVKELQRHPLRNNVLHADLFAINVSETISVSVPIHLIGTPKGVSLEGGLLDHALRELELDCLPRAIPDSIDVDVTWMEIGDALHVSDLVLPPDVELRSDPSQSVASVVAPTVEEVEPVAAAEAVPGEPGAAVEGEDADAKDTDAKDKGKDDD